MARTLFEFGRFNGGELSPFLIGRVDLERYKSCSVRMENIIPLAEGAATRRPGTRFVTELPAAGAVRLIEFEFSTGQAYVLVLVGGLIRFFANGGAVDNGTGNPLTLAHPYADADLPSLDYCQSADVLLLFHRSYPTKQLRRTAANAFTLTDWTYVDGPYADPNRTPIALSFSGTSGNITVAASGALFVPARDNQRWLRVRHGSTWGAMRIAPVDAVNATAAVHADFPLGATAASTSWRLGAFHAGNHPGSGTFFQQRLIVAGTPTQPQTLWGSAVGEFDRFSPSTKDGTVADADGFAFTIDDDQVNDVCWLAVARTLLVGTTGGTFTVQSSRLAEPITPTNVTVQRMSTVGSARRTPARINAAVFFIEFTRRRVHEISYNYSEDAYITPELSLLARHLALPRIRGLAYHENPWRTLWAVRDDGVLLGCTYLREQEVRGWHRHELAGQAEEICTIRETEADELWLTVRRTINGVVQRHLEYLTAEFVPGDHDGVGGTPPQWAIFSDASLSYQGPPVTTIIGLAHLVGREVAVLADGAVHPRRTVAANGSIALAFPAGVAQVGVPQRARLVSVPIEQMVAGGSTKGRPKHGYRATVELVATGAGHRIGPLDGPLDLIMVRRAAMPMDGPPPLFSGPRTILFPGGLTNRLQVEVRADEPTPLCLTAVQIELYVDAE